jgi:hypothetical protein
MEGSIKLSKAFDNYRLPKGQTYQETVFNRFKEMGFDITKHGFENIHPKLHSNLIQSDDSTSKINRYQPDQLIREKTLNNTCFIEVKYSDTIEKDPYQIYKKYYEVFDCKILICIKSKFTGKEYWVPIQYLELISGKESVSQYPPKARLPVDDGDWIAPRKWKDEDSDYYNLKKYYAWKEYSKASGTSYRYIDFKKLKRFHVWAYYPHLIKEWLSNHRIFMNVLIKKTEAR